MMKRTSTFLPSLQRSHTTPSTTFREYSWRQPSPTSQASLHGHDASFDDELAELQRFHLGVQARAQSSQSPYGQQTPSYGANYGRR